MKPPPGKEGSHFCLQAKARKHDRLGTNSTSIHEHIMLFPFQFFHVGSGKPGTRVTLSG